MEKLRNDEISAFVFITVALLCFVLYSLSGIHLGM